MVDAGHMAFSLFHVKFVVFQMKSSDNMTLTAATADPTRLTCRGT